MQIVHRGRFLFALVGFLVLLWAVGQASQWGYQSRLLPMVVGVTGLALLAGELLSTIRWRAGAGSSVQVGPTDNKLSAGGDGGEEAEEELEDDDEAYDGRRTLIMAGGLILYVIALYYIGFIAASLAFLSGTLYMLGTNHIVKVIGLSIGTVAAVYLSLTTLLSVQLP